MPHLRYHISQLKQQHARTRLDAIKQPAHREDQAERRNCRKTENIRCQCRIDRVRTIDTTATQLDQSVAIRVVARPAISVQARDGILGETSPCALNVSDEAAFSSGVTGTAEEGRRVEDVRDLASMVDAAVGGG